MPAYTLQKDPVSGRLKSTLASPSTYCDDYDDMLANDPPAPPAKDSREMPHPEQQITDAGPQTRGSRLPLFNQVRSMLHKPPPGKNPRWDKYTGELSEQGVPANVKPSAYVSPYEGAFQARRKSPERPSKSRKGPSPQPRLQAVRDQEQSPVSMLLDEDILRGTPPPGHQRSPSPVSPISPIDPDLRRIPLQDKDKDMVPKPLSTNVRQPQTVPQVMTPQPPIHRKPAPRSVSTTENMPPSPSPEQRSPSQISEFESVVADDRDAEPQPTSHFSWTTVAPSIAPGRAATETTIPGMAGRMSKPPSIYPIHQQDSDSEPNSRFSWSTVNTNMTHVRAESPPPSPPPAIPEKYIEQNSAPPVQSILSRRRPIQRLDNENTPPPRKSSMPAARSGTASPAEILTPINTKSLHPPLSKGPNATPTSAKSNKSGKALPPPPTLSPSHNLTHLEALLAQEKDLLQQRRNVERAIVDMEKIEKASPLDVDFSQVRNAKKKLDEHRKRLDEVRLEEREIGVAISRARRKEGEEEGLWVRRVTG